jgi:hypothetical protein
MRQKFILTIFGLLLLSGSAFAIAKSSNTTPEDLQILKDMLKQQISASDKFLMQAEGFNYQVYSKGTEITLAQCQAIETKLLKNYPIHSASEPHFGNHYPSVQICPWIIPNGNGYAWLDGSGVLLNTLHVSLWTTPVANFLGVKGASVLTVAFNDGRDADVLRQYILDVNSKMIQFTQSRFLSGTQLGDITISALNSNGDILATFQQFWGASSNEPYIQKKSAYYVSASGDISYAYSGVQNDGKGVELSTHEYSVPYNLKWDSFELTPYDRMGGLYKFGSKISSWVPTQALLKLYSKGTAFCGNGLIGYDDSDNVIRLFGDQNCEAEMDVQYGGGH